jgi:hypothetical protein
VDDIESTVAAGIVKVKLSENKPSGVVNVSPKFVLEGAEKAPKSVVIALACPDRTNKVEKTRTIHFDTDQSLDFMISTSRKFVCELVQTTGSQITDSI